MNEQIYFFAVLSIMQKLNCRDWERMNTGQLYWFTQLSYIQSSPKPRWNSLNHNSNKHKSHCSWNLQELRYTCWKNLFQHTHSSRNPIKKSVQPNFYKKWKVKRLHLIEDAEICLKPVEQIARTVATPHTKLLEPNKNKHFVIFEIFEEQMLILCKLLILCCKTCFLKCMIDV